MESSNCVSSILYVDNRVELFDGETLKNDERTRTLPFSFVPRLQWVLGGNWVVVLEGGHLR